MAIAGGPSRGAIAADGRPNFEAHHGQRALGMFDYDLAKEDLAEARDRKAMADALDAGARCVHLLDQGTKKDSVRIPRFYGLAGLKRIFCYFPEIALFSKLFLRLVEGLDFLEEVKVEVNMHGATGDAQIFKFAAHHGEEAFLLVGMMFRIEAGHHAIRGDDIQKVETFDCRRDQRVVAIIIRLVGPGDVSIAFAKGNELTKLKILDAGIAMATDDRKSGGGLHVDQLIKRPREMAAERVGTSMIVKRGGWLRGHKLILREDNE